MLFFIYLINKNDKSSYTCFITNDKFLDILTIFNLTSIFMRNLYTAHTLTTFRSCVFLNPTWSLLGAYIWVLLVKTLHSPSLLILEFYHLLFFCMSCSFLFLLICFPLCFTDFLWSNLFILQMYFCVFSLPSLCLFFSVPLPPSAIIILPMIVIAII